MDLYHQYAKEFTQYPTEPIESFYNSTGFGLADFLLGRVGGFTQGAGEIANVVGYQLGLYVQDQVKLKPNLTLTAGLRWDPNLPPSSQGGRGAVFVPGQKSTVYPNAPTGLVFPGDTGIDSALIPTTYGYFEPRIGLAFQPRSLPNTSFRAGFGLFTAPLSYSTYNHTADIAPFSPTYTIFANYTPSAGFPNGPCQISFDNPYASLCTFNGVAPFPPFASVTQKPAANSPFPNNVTMPATFSPNFKLGITQSWNASVEQQFPGQLALHLAYVGSESYHQTTVLDQNPGVYSATNPAISGSRTVAAGGSNNNSGAQQYSDRADIVPGVPVRVHQGTRAQWLTQYFNPAAFQPNAREPSETARRTSFVARERTQPTLLSSRTGLRASATRCSSALSSSTPSTTRASVSQHQPVCGQRRSDYVHRCNPTQGRTGCAQANVLTNPDLAHIQPPTCRRRLYAFRSREDDHGFLSQGPEADLSVGVSDSDMSHRTPGTSPLRTYRREVTPCS